MSERLAQLVNTIEYTDEMKQLQKDYEKLNKLSDLFDEAEELLQDLFDLKPICSNQEIVSYFRGKKRLDSTKAIKEIQELQEKVRNESMLTSAKVNELFSFQKLGNAISLYKKLDNDEKTENKI